MTLEAALVSPRRTKLRPPRLANDLISRPHLVERLNRLATVSLVVAPAGYGKTTLISLWLSQLSLPSGWVSLDEEDDDPFFFLANIVTALRAMFPQFGDDILEPLNSPRGRTFAELVTVLINELDTVEREFVLVLDDYHWVHNPAIHQLLIQLVTHPPHALHLVVISRHDPPLPWNLRTRGYLCEIRARDLSFTQTETAEFLAKVTEQQIQVETAKAFTEQSEGWITGIRLAGLNVRLQREAIVTPSQLPGDHRNVVDYFVAEVIDYLPDKVCDFLLRTSILNALNGTLCDFVLNDSSLRGRGAALLQQLEADGIFIVALDEDGTWYRLHPLFRHALQHKLRETHSNIEIAPLYERASIWHEEQGLLEEAIHYALVDQQVVKAVAIVHRHRQQLLDTMDFRRLERWLRQFPLSAVAIHPDLLLSKAWLMQFRFETLDERDCLEQVDTLLASLTEREQLLQEWKGEAAALRSQLDIYAGDVQAAAQSGKTALELLPRQRFYVRSIALLYLTFALFMTGESALVDSLLDAAAGDRWIARDLAILRTQQIRHFVELIAADPVAMRAGLPKLLQMAMSRNLKTSIAWSHYFWGCAAYLQNDLREAKEHFRAVLDLADHAHAGAYTHGVIGLALTRQAQGAPHEAAAIAASAQVYLKEMQLGQMLQVMNAFAADLAVRQGRVGDAMRWLENEGRDLPIDATPMFYVPGTALVKVLIATNTEESLATAQTWLTYLSEIGIQTRNIHSQIQTLALQAVLSEKQGNRQQALAAFDRALALAEPGRIVRVFGDLSVQLSPLLDQLQPGAVTAEFLLQVRSVVESDLETKVGAESVIDRAAFDAINTPVASRSAPGNGLPQTVPTLDDARDLSQILTYREMDVLRLLDQRLTNKEIARQLGISTETVRQHTVKLFRKLHVHNRRQAIVVARAMGYFE
jgi:LuxR family maltose regulon positive regulatory protein